jgi:hypothetical protein
MDAALGSAMSGPDMKADENGAYYGWSQRDEIVAYWRPWPV